MPDTAQTAEFVELFSKNAQKLYAYILTMMHHDPAADDVFQETSKLAWEKFDQYQPGTSFLAWTCRIAYFRVLNLRSKNRKAPVPFSDLFLEAVDGELAEMSETLDAEMKALGICYKKLTSTYRELIDLRYTGNITTKEVAKRVGRPLSTVYRMLDRVHHWLMNCIQQTLQEEPL